VALDGRTSGALVMYRLLHHVIAWCRDRLAKVDR
jgi:hypothetical protein